MSRSIVLSLLFLLGFVTLAFAADLTGRWQGKITTPNGDEIARAHGRLRAQLARLVPVGERVRILYGGSVKAGNAGAILALEHVDLAAEHDRRAAAEAADMEHAEMPAVERDEPRVHAWRRDARAPVDVAGRAVEIELLEKAALVPVAAGIPPDRQGVVEQPLPQPGLPDVQAGGEVGHEKALKLSRIRVEPRPIKAVGL